MPQKKIYHLKITLQNIKPFIWRRIEVPEEFTLYQLAAVIIGAMGWHGGHLHQFKMGEEYYGIPNDDDLSKLIDERTIDLSAIIEKQGIKKFIFEYDFGDGWEHVVQFEKAEDPRKGLQYPRCGAGVRCCPPEDCGGPSGYEDFLQAISDPNHPEHESMREWVGGDFDPERFDLEEAESFSEMVESIEEQWNEQFG